MHNKEELKKQEEKVHRALNDYINNKCLKTIKIYARELKQHLDMLLTSLDNKPQE